MKLLAIVSMTGSTPPDWTPMSAYIVFTREQTVDAAELELYKQQVLATMEGHAEEVLAAYGPQQVLEGPPAEGVVIARFADTAAARAWYDSPAYRAACAHRFRGAVYRAILVEGV
jgi:uncharacterized protein (DUF1330 family)